LYCFADHRGQGRAGPGQLEAHTVFDVTDHAGAHVIVFGQRSLDGFQYLEPDAAGGCPVVGIGCGGGIDDIEIPTFIRRQLD